MKALSLHQPWASMIASGQKSIETRRWATSYRGDLLIVSSKKPEIYPWPCGVALCVVELYNCLPMTRDDEDCACCKIYPSAHSWFLRNRRLIKPFPLRGNRRIFNVDVELEYL